MMPYGHSGTTRAAFLIESTDANGDKQVLIYHLAEPIMINMQQEYEALYGVFDTNAYVRPAQPRSRSRHILQILILVSGTDLCLLRIIRLLIRLVFLSKPMKRLSREKLLKTIMNGLSEIQIPMDLVASSSMFTASPSRVITRPSTQAIRMSSVKRSSDDASVVAQTSGK